MRAEAISGGILGLARGANCGHSSDHGFCSGFLGVSAVEASEDPHSPQNNAKASFARPHCLQTEVTSTIVGIAVEDAAAE